LKLQLNHIEAAIIPQFVWETNAHGGRGDALSRFATNEEWNLKSRTVGMSTFIGVALSFGFTLDQIKDYMDIEPYQVDDQYKVYLQRMEKMRDRQALETEKPEEGDLVQHAYNKAKLTTRYVQLNFPNTDWVNMSDHIRY
jgi:hypothetical protein